jgi:TolB-like protein/DNA-binding winged helix-turn-helix (wHTH) protein/Flp pilus assembly protein TadD
MPILEERSFSIADWRVFPDEDLITRGEQRVRLEPMAMDLLVYLASRPGDVVSRADIEQAVWQGALVGYDALTGTVIKLRKALGDSAKQPSFIATVPKRGYQLIAPITRHESGAFADTITRTDQLSSSGISRVNLRILGGFGILLVLTALVYWLLQPHPDVGPNSGNETVGTSSGKPSIAVLPFTNLSGDPEREYFSDGITEDIITELSRLSNLIEIARNSSFRYKNQTPKAQEAGADLGVADILEGSVRRAGERNRVTAQLVDTSNGHQVWANRYDQNLDDIFSLQDAITQKVVSSLSVELGDREIASRGRRATDSFEAYDLVLKGLSSSQLYTREGFEEARRAFRRAVALDPDYARAYGVLSVLLARSTVQGWTDSPAETLSRSLELARKAAENDPGSQQVLWALGYPLYYNKTYQEALDALNRAVEIAPNYADGYGLLGLISNAMGRAGDATSFIERGIKLNPHYSWDYPYNLGRAQYTKGNYEAAIDFLESALRRNESALTPRVFLAAAYAGQGQVEDAEWQVLQIETNHPDMTLTHLENTLPLAEGAHKTRLFTDLKTAGMPR